MATTRSFIVRTTRCAIIITIFSAFLLAGCGDEGQPTKIDTTAKPAPEEFKGMLGDQMKNANINETGKAAKK
jgi:hypothetical protein